MSSAVDGSCRSLAGAGEAEAMPVPLDAGRPVDVWDRGRPGRVGASLLFGAVAGFAIGWLARALARSMDICSKAVSSSAAMSSILLGKAPVSFEEQGVISNETD